MNFIKNLLNRKVPILTAEQRWECPNCTQTDVTYETKPHTRFHTCRGLKGLTAPFVPAGTRCKVEAVEREDYVGKEAVTLDGEQRPIMRVETTRDDGNDVAVLAPCANSRSGVN
ncbi:hypothetical protein [Streptomyces roseolus]|uniref:hypothetical protein n=1 Tax=Streptomyces roseolus TaxID=67358 RepID=UPI0016741310|nr:hypothetical protein [Streptomyces roseolus]GGR51950.1 hypothetical protein GCM10010282_51130 [Streptomyces roseolus]